MIGALLTRHVLQNYAKFVQGMGDIAHLQSDLQATLDKIKQTRQSVQSSTGNVATSLLICKESRQKQKAGELLDLLEKVQSSKDLGIRLRLLCSCSFNSAGLH